MNKVPPIAVVSLCMYSAIVFGDLDKQTRLHEA